MNLPSNIEAAVQTGAKRLRADGIRFVLVGTGALWCHGLQGIEAPFDVDFLCENITGSLEGLRISNPTDAQYGVHEEVDGIKVDYILADNGREKFLSAEPETGYTYPGVPVAALSDVLGLKWFAGRPKDLAFFAGLRKSPCFTRERALCAGSCVNHVVLHEMLGRHKEAIDAFLELRQKKAEALLA